MSKHQRKSHVHTTEITKSRTPAVTQLMSLLAEPSKLLGLEEKPAIKSQCHKVLGCLGMSRAGAFSALSNLSPRFLGRCSLYQTIQCGGPSFARLSPHTPSVNSDTSRRKGLPPLTPLSQKCSAHACGKKDAGH